MVDLGTPRPRGSTRQGFLVGPASHESSGARLVHIFDNSGPVRTDAARSVAAGDTLFANSGPVRTDAARSVAAADTKS